MKRGKTVIEFSFYSLSSVATIPVYTPFAPSKSCVHCDEREDNHQDGKCLFLPTEWLADEPIYKDAIVRSIHRGIRTGVDHHNGDLYFWEFECIRDIVGIRFKEARAVHERMIERLKAVSDHMFMYWSISLTDVDERHYALPYMPKIRRFTDAERQEFIDDCVKEGLIEPLKSY